MYQLLIYGSEDQYSYDNFQLQFQMSSVDLAKIGNYIANYKAVFDAKKYSSLHILLQNIDHKSGHIEVLENVYGENPLKERVIINQKALEIRQEKLKSKTTKAGGGTFVVADDMVGAPAPSLMTGAADW